MTTEVSSAETADRVLRLLVDHSLNGLVAASYRDIALELSIGRETAARAVRRLLAEDRIVVSRRGSGYLYPTTYVVGAID